MKENTYMKAYKVQIYDLVDATDILNYSGNYGSEWSRVVEVIKQDDVWAILIVELKNVSPFIQNKWEERCIFHK